MEPLIADDVRKVKFSSTRFGEGYGVVQVDEFLERVIATLKGTTNGTQTPNSNTSQINIFE